MAAANQLRNMDSDISDMVTCHKSLFFCSEKNKIICRLSGHEMPLHLEAVQSYVNGKKYKRLGGSSYIKSSVYGKHLVPSKKKGHMHQLFCKLTWRHLNKDPRHIEKHVSGRRFRKSLQRWQECQTTGTKFLPNRGQGLSSKHNVKSEGNNDSDNGDTVESDDNMSDLLPEESDEEPIEQDVHRSDDRARPSANRDSSKTASQKCKKGKQHKHGKKKKSAAK